jgi:large repetitive protein
MHRKIAVLLVVLTSFCLHAALGPGAETAVTPPAYGAINGSQETVAVATDGTDFLALWRDETPARNGIYATIVSESGATRPVAPVPLLRGLAGADAVWTGSSYLVVLSRYLQPTFVVNLDRDGQIVAPLRPLNLAGDGGLSDLTWNGSRVLAIGGAPAGGYRAALLDAEGNVVRPDVALPSGVRSFTVSTAGSAFVFVWTEELVPQEGSKPPQTRVRAARISAAGDVSAPVELLQPEHSYVGLDSASGGAEAGVVVQTGNSSNSVLRRYTIDAALVVDAEPPLALDAIMNSNVSVVATARGFVATYFALVVGKVASELRTLEFGETTQRAIDLPQAPGHFVHMESNSRTVMGFWGVFPARAAAFDASLTRFTSAIFPVPTAPVAQGRPVIASAGDTGVIAWNESGTLKLRRVNREGLALDAQPVVIATNADHAAAVFTGRTWLLAWLDVVAEEVKVRWMSPEGVLLGEPLTLGFPTTEVALASNGNVAVLVTSLGVNRRGLTLTRFSADGERLDPTPLVLTDERSTDHPAIASNGDGFLVVWNRSTGYNPHVYGKRLDASGNPIEAEPIAIANGAGFSQGDAQVASNGEDYVVVYVRYGEFEIQDPPQLDGPHPEPARIFAKRVLANGVLGDTTPDQDGAELGLGRNPEITADDSRYVATFTKADQDTLWLFAVPLHPYGEALTAPRLLLRAESHAQEHAIGSIGGALFAAYSRVVPELASVQRVFLREVAEQQTTRRRGSRN